MCSELANFACTAAVIPCMHNPTVRDHHGATCHKLLSGLIGIWLLSCVLSHAA